MKRIISLILSIILVVLIPCTAFADGTGEGNMDGGGGSMGGGTGGNFWHEGEDGVRVTVVRISDNNPVSIPIDLTNSNENDIYKHFGKKSKVHYRSGSTFMLFTDNYTYTKPSKALPRIISSGGNANIAAIKSYFCSEETLKKIASIIGTTYDTLIDGKYKLLIEPVAYFTFNGYKMAMTATEAALYDQKLSGGLRSKMVSLTHQNLPLSMFLEKSDLGYPAYSGSTTKAQSDTTIISYLGLGIVKFKEDPPTPPPVSTSTATYRTNTDVITSVTLNTDSQINPNSPARVTFNIGGSSYSVTNIVIPEGDSQVVWVKWHTPSTAQKISISMSASKGSLSASSITADIVSLDNNIPPDPTADDKNDGFTTPSLPSNTQITSNSWGVWSAVWVPNWVWHEDWHWVKDSNSKTGGHWKDNGKWVDEGSWKYTYTGYHASLSASMSLLPDDKVPSAQGKQMASGYGVKINVSANLNTTAPSAHYTCAQTGVSYFPEFDYKTYWRHLALTANGESSSLAFKPNIYSTYNRGVHFTPLWFPDGKYTTYTYLQDAWTPGGMLSMNLNDYVTIKGNVYQDWHIGPKLAD
jgi:hypothetical protein